MNALTPQTTGTAVAANTGYNAYEQYGNAVSSRAIVGDLLKFQKGEYTSGQNDDEVEIGTKLVANMDDLAVGWVKWWDGKPADHIMGRVAEGYQPDKRNALGDLDKTEWETDKEGRPQDPWQQTNYLLLKDVDGDEVYTFATSSAGGRNAIADLCKQFGKAMRQHPDEHPIIELDTDSYRHKEYGKVHVPKLSIVGWVSKDGFAEAVEANSAEQDADEAPKKAGKTSSAAKF